MPRRDHTLLAALSATLLLSTAAIAEDSPTFRGPERDGMFSSAGLAETWPEGGPERLWLAHGLGEGYSSVAIAGKRLFTTGTVDGQGHLIAFDLNGKHLWTTGYGAEHPGNGYPGSRTTPSTDGQGVFALSSTGVAVAVEAATGKLRWSKNVLEAFDGENIYFGVSESPLLDGDRVIFTPGGQDASLVALDKATGELVWRSTGLSDTSAYCSARLVEINGQRQIITFLSKGLVSLDPKTGKVLWTQDRPAEYNIHAVSPLVRDDLVVVSHGYGLGSHGYRMSDEGKIAEIWHQKKLDIHHGGGVLVDDSFIGAASKGTWYRLDANTGEIQAEARRLGKGSVVYADGKLFGYTEGGDVVLVDPDDLSVHGKVEITEGEGQHWGHPVIVDGILYLRHGDALMAYDIRAKKTPRQAPAAEKTSR